MKTTISIIFIAATIVLSGFYADAPLQLYNKNLRLSWQHNSNGWVLEKVEFNVKNTWKALVKPSGEHTLLYSAAKPDSVPQENFKTITGENFPDPLYKYQVGTWKQSILPVPMNTAGTAFNFFPQSATVQGQNKVVFKQENEVASISSEWMFDAAFPGDVIVTQSFKTKKAGYFSLASPSLLNVDEKDMSWVTVPGYFQGNQVEKNFVLSYAYGQGIPDKPVIYRERSASNLSPIISMKNGISLSVIPDPVYGRDPWANDKSTHQDWFVGISHRNRRAQLSPTVYYPVLGEPKSKLEAGETVTYKFRYSLVDGDWYAALKHSINDISHFDQALALRKNKQSLTSRVEEMHKYLVDGKTSMWKLEDFEGAKIGAQAYLGGVVGSSGDAMKNSDYGAMWMLANTTADPILKNNVLPYALNFKLAQQQTTAGFFQGAAIGQYFLTKPKKFVEEWGTFIEPISLTYYTMLDIGNVLLFEPQNQLLQKRLQLGADQLLKWQKPDGSWEVAYDRQTEKALFLDIKDLRPTFYGMIVAYRILRDKKYLDAARKGADWFIKNAVDKGAFIGVCGDARYAPDFATAQSAQALLDLYDITMQATYKEAAIAAAKIYTASVYSQPVPSRKLKTVKGVPRQDWEISQSGLSFEHGGILGSSNTQGPIQLCSHAGLFIRMFELTKDPLFVNMARAAALGRDAFVDSATSVASYYWNAMNRGAGPYPHHAWWQIGWITDYLMAEAEMRSEGKIVFPRGFVTPKVGPHQTYGFAPGKIFGQPASLIKRTGLLRQPNPQIEHITAFSPDKKRLFIILLNDGDAPVKTNMNIDVNKLEEGKQFRVTKMTSLTPGEHFSTSTSGEISIPAYGLRVFAVDIEVE